MFLVYEAWFFNFLQQLHHLCHICFWCFYCLFTDIQFGGNLLSKVKCDVLDNWHYGKQCFSVKFYATLARSWAMVNMCYCCRCQWFQCPLLPLLFYSLVVFELIKNYSLDSVSFSFFFICEPLLLLEPCCFDDKVCESRNFLQSYLITWLLGALWPLLRFLSFLICLIETEKLVGA